MLNQVVSSQMDRAESGINWLTFLKLRGAPHFPLDLSIPQGVSHSKMKRQLVQELAIL
jgi:hypothetical protein